MRTTNLEEDRMLDDATKAQSAFQICKLDSTTLNCVFESSEEGTGRIGLGVQEQRR